MTNNIGAIVVQDLEAKVIGRIWRKHPDQDSWHWGAVNGKTGTAMCLSDALDYLMTQLVYRAPARDALDRRSDDEAAQDAGYYDAIHAEQFK